MVENRQYLSQHLAELKSRLLKVIAVFAVSFTLAFTFKENIFALLASPLQHLFNDGQGFIFTHLAEAFFVYLKLALWTALFATVPFALAQLYLFIAPGLYKNEKQFIVPVFIFSTILFFGGICFVYLYLMPTAWSFFLNFTQNDLNITLQAKISEYFNFSLQLMLAFGLAFQLPVLLIVLAKIGLINHLILSKGRKYAILAIAIFSALLTPPDLISQIALIIPLMLMYEVTILLLKFNKNSKM